MPESQHYTPTFYDNSRDGSRNSAQIILPIVNDLFQPKSVIDVGCGSGQWLKVWNENLNVQDIQGVEGPYLKGIETAIPKDKILLHDLKTPLNFDRRFDLAMTVEVAEHIPPENAETFVKSLTSLSDVIVFSAALLGQGGIFHVNEQLPEYWASLFQKQGYEPVDHLRPIIWNDKRIQFWYRQNILIFIKKSLLEAEPPALPPAIIQSWKNTRPDYLIRVHPEHYILVNHRTKLRGFLRYKWNTLTKAMKRS